MPSASEKSNAFSVEKTFNPKLKYFPQSSKKYETTVCKLKKKKTWTRHHEKELAEISVWIKPAKILSIAIIRYRK